MNQFLINGSMQKTLAGLLLFVVGLGSFAICGYQILLNISLNPLVMTLCGMIISYCLHQLGYSTGMSASILTPDKYTELSSNVAQTIISSINAHADEMKGKNGT